MALGVQLGGQVTRDFHADVLLYHFGLVPVLHAILHVVHAHKTQTSNPASCSASRGAPKPGRPRSPTTVPHAAICVKGAHPFEHRRQSQKCRRKWFAGSASRGGVPAASQQGDRGMVLPAAQATGAGANGLLFAPPQITHATLADGSVVLRSERALGPVPRAVGIWLEKWAAAEPLRTFLAAREAGAWRTLTYGAALKAAQSFAQALLERRLLGPSGRPI